MRTFDQLVRELAKFPHIQWRLEVLWGSKDCRDYLADLIIPNRPGRQGFDFTTFLIIEELTALHDHFYPKFAPKDGNWTYQGKNLP